MFRRVVVVTAIYTITTLAIGIIETARGRYRAGLMLLVLVPLTLLIGYILWVLFGQYVVTQLEYYGYGTS
jgi:hypothetical protein